VIPSGGLSLDHQRWVHPRSAAVPVSGSAIIAKGDLSSKVKDHP
jgi:hypothetical protein